ncbi:MAG: MFS transporter [Negativicutes bacterium]|nr:MFS transporter [Negativicutes bacterium]
MTEPKKSFITKPLLLVALSHVMTDLSAGALPILLPFFKSAFALSYSQVGFIVLTQNFTSSIIQPLFGYLTDRLSLPWLVPAGLLLAGMGMAATGLATSYHVLLMIVIITGLGIASFHPQAAKAVHSVSSVHSRGQSMSIFSLGGNLGQACGSVFMMALLTLPGSLNNTLYFCLPAVILATLLWLNLPQISPENRRPSSRGTKGPAKTSIPYAVVAILLSYIFLRSSISAGLVTYIPLYYADYLGGSHLYASYLLSAYLLSGVAGTFVGGTLGDRFGRKTIIMGSMLLVLPLLNLLKYATGYWTFPLVAFIGFIYIASFSSTIVLAQEMMPGYEALGASLTTGFSIGLGGVAVTLLGYVADHFGVPSVFSVIAVIPLAAFSLAFFLPGRLFRPDNAPVGNN